MPEYGAYVLDLYCDIEAGHLLGGVVNYEFAGGKAQFAEEATGSAARRAARKAGWKIGRTYVICPKCAKHTKAERRALNRV